MCRYADHNGGNAPTAKKRSTIVQNHGICRSGPQISASGIIPAQAIMPSWTTQTNVDDLHERAGTQAAIHLHGSLFTPHCVTAAAHPATFPDPPDGEATEPHEGRRVSPPRCASCQALVRPRVVWFGEALSEAALTTAAEVATACDVLLTVGTSGVVYPAAEIPRIAASSGATVIQVNPQPTPLDRIAAINLRGTAAQVLPTLVAAARR